MLRQSAKSEAASATERRFYARSKAFGRFGMRIFKPQVMDQAHHHGHIELNFARRTPLLYKMNGTDVVIEPDQLVMFWANVPHQLTAIESFAEPELCNIYIPLDVFLMMPRLAPLQVELLNGAMILCPRHLCSWDMLMRWYGDYRSKDAERLDIFKMELNALFRRIDSAALHYAHQPWSNSRLPHSLTSSHIRHVVAMIQYVLENLAKSVKNADVTSVTGLHPNYALNIFAKAMNIPLKQFVLRMRLLRARSFLLESDLAISSVAEQSGFGSTSQFYAQFTAAYGLPPSKLRNNAAAQIQAPP